MSLVARPIGYPPTGPGVRGKAAVANGKLMFSGVGKRPQTAVKGGADWEIVKVLPVKPSCATRVHSLRGMG